MDDSVKNPLNAEGKFYIDMDTCLACVACSDEAPNLIKSDPNTGTNYVFKQPTNEQELVDMQRAIDVCCVAAFRDDG